MSDFRLFETNKKASFLSKAKEVKAKREGDLKKNQSILLLQKHLRAFIAFRKHDSPSVSTDHQQYAQAFWESMDGQFPFLRKKYVKQAIRALTQGQELAVGGNLESAIKAYSCSCELKEGQYRAILQAYWKRMDLPYIEGCMRFKSFREALVCLLSSIHELVDFAIHIESLQFTNEILTLYFSSRDSTAQIEQEDDQQRILKTYHNSVILLTAMIDNHQDTNSTVRLVSIMIQKLRRFYMDVVMQRYNIDRGLFQSAELREEIEQTVKQKREWEEYESHLYLICKLIPGIMNNYISRENKGITYALDILIQVTKLGESVVALNITPQEFFILLERLSGKITQNREEQHTRYYEYLIIIFMIEKYLQATNDLKFKQLFQYEAERLKEAIRGSVIPFVKGLVNISGEASIIKQINRHSLAFLNNLYNKIFRTALLKTTVFEDPSINIFQANYKYSNYGNASYLKEMYKLVELCPFLLPIDTRFLVFRKLVREDSYHEHGNKSIVVNRGRQFEDAMAQLFNRNMKGRFHILFINQYGKEESGMDAGGLTKEFLTRLFKTAFDPSRKWFIENDRKELLPNPDYWKIQEGPLAREYEFIGRLLAKSLRQNIMLGVKFAGPFLNLLINNRNTFDDLQVIDPDLYRSLIFIAEMKEGVEQLSLTFQYHDNLTKKTVNLKPFGEKIRVNGENKMEYVNLLINYKVNRMMERQTRHLRKGLRAVINENWVKMFNYAEFNYLLSGTGTIDVRDWRAHSHSHHGKHDKLMEDFWSIVSEFSEEEKSLLLKFVTSCERPSFLGFKDLQPPFTIRVTQEGDGQLPVSHTCSNVLDLPAYSNKKVMREKLLYAIKAGAGFEMA